MQFLFTKSSFPISSWDLRKKAISPFTATFLKHALGLCAPVPAGTLGRAVSWVHEACLCHSGGASEQPSARAAAEMGSRAKEDQLIESVGAR